MKKEIDMGIFLEDDARYADAVNVFGNMPKGTVTEEAVEPYDTKLHFAAGAIVKNFLLGSREWRKETALQQRKKHLFAKQRDTARRIIFGVNFIIEELEL